MRIWRVASLLATLATTPRAEDLRTQQTYRVEEGNLTTIIAPGVALAEAATPLAVLSAPTLQACAAACRSRPDCTAFEICEAQASLR